MQGPSADESDDVIAAINIIPLVDVVLVLLIIFMVTTVFSKGSALKIDLPKGAEQAQMTQPPAEITVAVDAKEHIFVNGLPATLDNMLPKINALVKADRPRKSILVLKGDKVVHYGKIMPVLDEISRSGVQLTLALTPGTRHDEQQGSR